MWGCLSFSRSHASRDMICYSDAESSLYDMFSLYYTSPFLDTSKNINGTQDVSLLSVSSSPVAAYFHFVSGFRPFDTNDD